MRDNSRTKLSHVMTSLGYDSSCNIVSVILEHTLNTLQIQTSTYVCIPEKVAADRTYMLAPSCPVCVVPGCREHLHQQHTLATIVRATPSHRFGWLKCNSPSLNHSEGQ